MKNANYENIGHKARNARLDATMNV